MIKEICIKKCKHCNWKDFKFLHRPNLKGYFCDLAFVEKVIEDQAKEDSREMISAEISEISYDKFKIPIECPYRLEQVLT